MEVKKANNELFMAHFPLPQNQYLVTPYSKKTYKLLLFPSFATNSNSLAIRRPGDVLDLATDRLVLVLQDVLLLGGVPNPELTTGI